MLQWKGQSIKIAKMPKLALDDINMNYNCSQWGCT